MYELMKGNLTQIFKKQMKTFKTNWCHMVHSETLVKGKLNLEYINDFLLKEKNTSVSSLHVKRLLNKALDNIFLYKKVSSVT